MHYGSMIANRNGEKQMRTIDLFSGCGGMSLGFQNAGFEIVAAFDNWEPAVNIYRQNFKHPIYKEDLNEDTPVEQVRDLKPDIIIGSFIFIIQLIY